MKTWERVALCVGVFLFVLVFTFNIARELYVDAHTRSTWSEPGTFDPAKAEKP